MNTRFNLALLSLALCLPLVANASTSWISNPLETQRVDLPEGSVEILVPQGMQLDDRNARSNMADWKPEVGPSYKGPSISIFLDPYPPKSVQEASADAIGSRSNTTVTRAEAVDGGYLIVYSVGDSSAHAASWRSIGKRSLKCRTRLSRERGQPSMAEALAWAEKICSSASASATSPRAVAAGAAAGAQISDATVGLSITLPAGWVSQRDPQGGPIQFGSTATAMSKGPGDDAVGGMLFTGSVAQMGKDPVALLDRFVEKTTQGAQDRGKASSLRIKGRPAARLNYSGTMSGVKAMYSFYAIVGERNVVLIMGVDGSRGKHLAALAEMAMSASIN
ncbi:hypothetical protein [Pseudomarimonas arenosa]|uniref:DUF1795 domain-containing protein n=1 Tax=Pseudomarimonas arenosa TaxID=2774145 RepID=A0AAW3ZIH8_9GAMM|nr:hypothetical protein [Pseudomarimonas arenosa]MBD8525885.1 hypothetical protein [Pseudomarimonas arenosa]